MKLLKEHIADEWDEGHPDNGGDGYWIVLRSGLKWDGDPSGTVHAIHENTRKLAYREGVTKCTCRDCEH